MVGGYKFSKLYFGLRSLITWAMLLLDAPDLGGGGGSDCGILSI